LTFLVVVLVMGASGIIAQLLLLRELLITFFSNELSIGIILANWLLLEAAGSYFLGRLIDKARRKTALFVAVTVVFSLAFPAAITLARTWKTMIGAVPGEGMGLHQIFLASFFILLPVSLTHGALFTFASRMQAGLSGRGAAGIGRVYFLENAGTLAGGLLFTFLLITQMNSIEAAFAVSLTNILVCLPLLRLRGEIDEAGGAEDEGRSSPPWAIAGLTALATIGAAVFLLGPLPGRIHVASIGRQWVGQEVVHYENSVYGNMAVIEREGEYTFFSDGVPTITTPTPDVIFVEEFSHLPLLHHPRPREILVISGGAGGVLREILKHPVERIDYVELDPLVLRLVERFPTELTAAELSDPRVEVFYRDGRLYLKETDRSYDVVLVGLSDPRDLQINRFFTRQFFSLVADRLKVGGVVAFSLPGSLTYMGPEMRDLNACIINTLGDIFPGLRVIPGDGVNILIASPSPDLSSCDVDCLEERLEEAALPLSFINSFHLRYRLDPRWTTWFADSMREATRRRNDDLRPLGVFYSLSHWNAKFAPRLQGIVSRVGEVSFALIAAVMGIVAVPLFLLARRKGVLRVSVPLAVLSTGFAGMIFDLALMFTFQALYGVVFYWIGLLVTAFMAGSAAGSFAMTRIMERLRRDAAVFMAIEGALVAFSLLLPVTFLGFEPYLEQPGLTTVIRVMFLVLSFLSGLLTGLEFPLAGKIIIRSSSPIGRTAGFLYGADLIGGWVGGIIGGVVLLPVLGLVETCLTLAVLKLVSLLLVAASSLPGRKGAGFVLE
jgi:spermidine synthase